MDPAVWVPSALTFAGFLVGFGMLRQTVTGLRESLKEIKETLATQAQEFKAALAMQDAENSEGRHRHANSLQSLELRVAKHQTAIRINTRRLATLEFHLFKRANESPLEVVAAELDDDEDTDVGAKKP